MPAPQDPTDRELYLAELGSRDEGVEALLSGGADIDDLIAAGVLSDDEPVFQEEEGDEVPIEPSTLTDDEIRAWLHQRNDWLVANGHRSPTWQSERGYGQLSNRTN